MSIKLIAVVICLVALGLLSYELSRTGDMPQEPTASAGYTRPTPPYTETSWETFTRPSSEVLRTTLTPTQYAVTQDEATEIPYSGEYNKNYEDGIYVDVVSGEPLFSSKDKYDSGTGWPSFVKPITKDAIGEREDGTLLTIRTEVHSAKAGSHLGHVFDDGPIDRGGLRYCINSAALRFISKADMEREGYGYLLSSV